MTEDSKFSYKRATLACVVAVNLMFFYTNCGGGFSEPLEFNSAAQVGTLPEVAIEQDGQHLYTRYCASCHGDFQTSTKLGTSLASVNLAISGVQQMSFLKTLPKQFIENIAYALAKNSNSEPEGPFVETPPIPVNNWAELKTQTCAPTGVTRDLRLLDPSQYKDIVTDVFGFSVDVTTLPSESHDYYVPEVASSGSGITDLLHLEALYKVAESVGAYTFQNTSKVSTRFSTCNIAEKTCQDQISTAILSQLFRRKLDSSHADYVAIMNKFSAVTDFKARLQNIVLAGLMSPHFLYIAEAKAGFRTVALTQDTLRSLDDYELASRLSFMLWNSVPDTTLLNLAQQKSLSQLSNLKAQIPRMLADTRSQRFVKKFTSEWLDIEKIESISKDKSMHPAFSADLMRKFKNETESFASYNFTQDKDIRNLFTSDTTFVDSSLAQHYGIAGISGSSYVEARRPQSELHAGILSHGSLSAVSSSSTTDPIHRGTFAFQRFLCGQLGLPPASAALVVIEGTKYEQLQGRKQLMSCASCHKKFEPLGYVSERLSPLGQFRLKDEAGALTGEKVELENGKTVQTLQELGLELSSNPMIGYCLSQNLAKYALRGSYLSSESIKCQTQNSVYEAYQAGNSLKDYVEAVVLSPSFARKMEKK